MPTLKVVEMGRAPVGAAQRPSCEVKFYWDEVPQRGRPSLIWCLRCCIDRLEGRSKGLCYRTVGEAHRCFNCLSQLKPCADVPPNITAYGGKCRFKDETYKPHADGDMLAALKYALKIDYESMPDYVHHERGNSKSDEDKDMDDEAKNMDEDEEGESSDDNPQARTGEDINTSDDGWYSKDGIARRIPYTPKWANELKRDH